MESGMNEAASRDICEERALAGYLHMAMTGLLLIAGVSTKKIPFLRCQRLEARSVSILFAMRLCLSQPRVSNLNVTSADTE